MHKDKKDYYTEASGFFLTRPYPKDWDTDWYWEDKKWADLDEFIDEYKNDTYRDDWESFQIEEEIEKLSNLLFEVVSKEVSSE